MKSKQFILLGILVLFLFSFSSLTSIVFANYFPDKAGYFPQAPGDLDTGFGSNGIVIPFGSQDSEGWDIAVQLDGKIVGVGYLYDESMYEYVTAVVRYNSNGTLDTSFGGDGIVTTGLSQYLVADAIAIQSDNKILVAGTHCLYGNCDMVTMRYTPNGLLDSTFNVDGIATVDISNSDGATSMTIQSDNKIIIVGYADDSFAVVRYNINGSLDSTFGGDGIVTTSLGTETVSSAMDLAVQSDGRIVVTGRADNNGFVDFAVVRYTSAGALDTSYGGGDGIVLSDLGGDDYSNSTVKIVGNKLLVAGESSAGSPTTTYFAAAQYTDLGNLDTAFGGGDGFVITDISEDADYGADVMFHNGKIIVVGYGDSNSNVELVRYNSDGTLDLEFNGDGLVNRDLGGFEVVRAGAQQSDDKILVTGSKDGAFFIARFIGGVSSLPTPTQTNTPTPPTSSLIKGRILDIHGNPLMDVNLYEPVSGMTAITDSNGEYHFNIVAEGEYRIRPSLYFYKFIPEIFEVSVPGDNEHVDFEAIPSYIERNNAQLLLYGEDFYIAGTSNYFITYKEQDTVHRIMDMANEMNLNVLRIWGFNSPNLSYLDYVISRARSHGIRLVITLTDNWYNSQDPSWKVMDEYVVRNGLSYHDQFYTNPIVIQDYQNYVTSILNRQNTITKIPYKDDPTILTWELANEPRCQSDKPNSDENPIEDDPENDNIADGLYESGSCTPGTIVNWADLMSTFIKSLDPHHLISMGDEGFFNFSWDFWGGNYAWWRFLDPYYNGSMKGDFEALLQVENIDFGTVHLYPEDWGNDDAWGDGWIKDHIRASRSIGKPVIIEEFGSLNILERKTIYESWTRIIKEEGGNGFLFWMLGDLENWDMADNYWILSGTEVAQVLSRSSEALLGQIGGYRNEDVYQANSHISQGNTVDAGSFSVTDQAELIVSLNWPGSSVDTTLIDPRGRRINYQVAEADPSIEYTRGNVFEYFKIHLPEVGRWSIELYGADLPDGGENVSVRVFVRNWNGAYLPLTLHHAIFSQPTNSPPSMPYNNSPADGAVNQDVNVNLIWLGGDPDGDAVTYDVYLEVGDTTPDLLSCNDVSVAYCDPSQLTPGAQYYWKVVARDEHGVSMSGPVWDFITSADGDFSLGLYSYFPMDGNSMDVYGYGSSGEVGETSYGVGKLGQSLLIPTDAYNTMVYFGSDVDDLDNTYADFMYKDATLNVWVKVNEFDTLAEGFMEIFSGSPHEIEGRGGCQQDINHWQVGIEEVPGCIYGCAPSSGSENFFFRALSYNYEGVYEPASTVKLIALDGELTPGTWYMLTITHDNATHTWKLYINGVLQDSLTMATGIGPGGSHFACPYVIGNRPLYTTYGHPFSGLIDELAFWDRILLPGVIVALYNFGSGVPLP